MLDLTRRLAQANPHLDDPAAEAEAVVLIDEIDLHLHPKWQRHIVHNLHEAFPHCQLIATTHSPQVIGEVEHERIQIIADGQVYSPSHSYGVDSSRVLEEVMDSEPRTKAVKELLAKISQAIGKQRYEHARGLLARLVEQLGETDPEVTRLSTLLNFVEGKRMRAITKGAEPPSLTAHRQTPHCDYDNYPDKAALRQALVTEQRSICCYCMRRIRNGRSP